jgi:ferric-dicitrate binding protein FerR (iron transport regulator)
MKNVDQHELLSRYFSGEATTAERAKIEAWRQASAENQRVFSGLAQIWQNAAPEKLPPIPHVDQAWSELSAQLGLPPEAQPARILEMKKTPQTTAPVRKVFWSDRYVWAAAAVLLLAFATILYQYSQKATGLKTVATAYAQQESVELPDGSLVKLNSGSRIQFPKNFPDSARYVVLTGEAYFEVTHDHRPFYVNTGNAQIRVLGTQFGIWARDEQTRVTVREGRVSLRALELPPAAAVELTANQTSICRQQNPPEPPRTIDAGHLLGWLEGKIVFDQTALTEVVAELQRVYKVTIELSDPALGQHTITGSFHRKPIESVLASICLTLDLQYSKQDDKFVISR